MHAHVTCGPRVVGQALDTARQTDGDETATRRVVGRVASGTVREETDSDYCDYFHGRCRTTTVQRPSAPICLVEAVTTRNNHYDGDTPINASPLVNCTVATGDTGTLEGSVVVA